MQSTSRGATLQLGGLGLASTRLCWSPLDVATARGTSCRGRTEDGDAWQILDKRFGRGAVVAREYRGRPDALGSTQGTGRGLLRRGRED